MTVEFCETLHKMIDEHKYNEEELYNCDETAFYYRTRPIKSLDIINKYENQQRKGAFMLEQVQERLEQISTCMKSTVVFWRQQVAALLPLKCRMESSVHIQ